MSLLRKTTRSQPSPLRSNSSRVIVLNLDDTEYEIVLQEAAHRGYSRPRLEDNLLDEDQELPEYIRWRLFLARQVALIKARKTWT